MHRLFLTALIAVCAARSVLAAPPAEFSLKDLRHTTTAAYNLGDETAWIIFSASVTNTSDQPLWIVARPLDDPPSLSPYIRRLARADSSAPWIDLNTAWCYSDYTLTRIDAKATLSFKVSVPERYAGQDFRADLTIYAAEDAPAPLAILSVTERLTTRSSEQAGR